MSAEVRRAATVVLVRDRDVGGGLEVFLLQRNHESIFVPGAHLFPGGAVDDGDHDPEFVARSRLSDTDALRLLAAPEALGSWVAVVRETFEEAGVLLASHRDRPIDFGDAAVRARFDQHRDDVDTGRRPFLDVCREEDLVLLTDTIHPLSRWITPEGAPRRYDTRFFVARAPADQRPVHDDREAIASTWATPAKALERWERGDWTMIEPTWRTLELLAAFGDTEQLIGTLERATVGPASPVIERRHGAEHVALNPD